jgi:L-asparagine oxygenase
MGEIDLTINEINILIDLATKNKVSPSTYPELFCKFSKNLSLFLPEKIKNSLHRFSISNHTNDTPFLLFRNVLPTIDSIEKTPEDIHQHIGETTLLSKIQSILLSYLGEMISYEAEGNGYLFQDIIPVKEMSGLQTSIGSNTELEIHTEQAFSSLRPDILCLACLKTDENALTYILPISVLLSHLSTDEIELLWQPLWYIGVDLSFRINGKADEKIGPISILRSDNHAKTRDNENIFLVFDQDLMTGIHEEAQQMIIKITDIYYKYRITYCLQPGDILLLDNRFVVHGRSSFSPKFDGNDRFLIRSFAVLDYEKSEYARKERMVMTKYS